MTDPTDHQHDWRLTIITFNGRSGLGVWYCTRCRTVEDFQYDH